MAFASGIFNRIYSFVADAAGNIPAQPIRFDNELNGMATGLSTCILKDGSQQLTSNIPWGGFKITGLGAGSNPSDSVNLGQLAVYAALAGATFTGAISVPASVAANAFVTVPHGVAPTTPINGNLWSTTSGFFGQVNGSTRQITTLNGAETLTNKALDYTSTVSATGTAAANSIGYLGLPQNGKTASYTLVLSDFGNEIYLSGSMASQAITIPANAATAFPVGAFVVITNDSSVPWTIPITTDTLIWSPSLGAGTRTLAAGGTCTISKKTATRWWISGAGLS